MLDFHKKCCIREINDLKDFIIVSYVIIDDT